jgi:hypothetical protein
VKRRKCGVTLLKILIVIGIITIVVGICIAAVGPRARREAKQAQVKVDLKQVSISMNIYRADHDDGLPRGWVDLGYYQVNKKDKFGIGFPPHDVKYASPPSYDISYHTPQCKAPPKGSLQLLLIDIAVKRFFSRPRAEKLEVDQTTLADASWICKPGPSRTVSYFSGGQIKKVILKKEWLGLSVNMNGTIFFAPPPAWAWEMAAEGA